LIKKKIPEKLPNHIGIILDGNGRWATRQGLPRNFGHREGVNAIVRTAEAARKFGIKRLSVFAFSTENWKRSDEEVQGIFDLLKEFFVKELDRMVKNGVKINFFGDLSRFKGELREILDKTVLATENNDTIIVNICLNYGGKQDIVQAVNKLIAEGKKEITEEDIANNLYSKGQPDLDFVIRTSGEQRISNFMIYQSAYAELYFPKILWPDFDEKALYEALIEYSKRKRRFGGY
jgi:undecaprenyl diphosphate synthase